MKKLLLFLLVALAAPFAQAANTTISGLAPAASITGSEQLGMDQGPATVRYSLWKIIGLPQNTQNNSYVFALSDQGAQVYHSDTNAYTYTIPLNSLVAFPIGSQINVVNNAAAGTITITPAGGVTLQLSSSSSTGAQTVTAQTVVTILKTGTDQWILNAGGSGGGGGGGITSFNMTTTYPGLTLGGVPCLASGCTVTLNPTTGLSPNLFSASPGSGSGPLSLRGILAGDIATALATSNSMNGSGIPANAGTLPGTFGSFTIGDCASVYSNFPVILQDAGAPCGGGGGTGSWATILGGTSFNAFVIGSGGSFSCTGTGVCNANEFNGAIGPASASYVYTNSGSQLLAGSCSNGVSCTGGATTASYIKRIVSGSTDTLLSSDCANGVSYTGSAVTVTIPAGTSLVGCASDLYNDGTGLVTLTPASGTISTSPGATGSTFFVYAGRVASIYPNGTNWTVSGTAFPGSTPYANLGGAGTTLTPSCQFDGEVTYGTFTATGGTFTVNAPTGCTPGPLSKIALDLKFTNAQTYSWNSTYKAGTVALPTTSTGGGAEDLITMWWSPIQSKWLFTATATGY